MTTINLAPFFEKQRELDAFIVKKFGLEDDENLYKNRVMAFQVELMECCNSWRGFKYWTEHPAPKDDLLEEYVDGMHFLLSIGNMLHEDEDTVPTFPSKHYNDKCTPFVMFALCSAVAPTMYEDNYYQMLVWRFFDLGYSLGFTWEQIAEAYDEKYKTNIQRMNSGY